MKTNYHKYFEFDDFKRLQGFLSKNKKPNDEKIDPLEIKSNMNFIYLAYIRPFGMDFIKEKSKNIDDKHLKTWMDYLIKNTPKYIVQLNNEFEDELEDILEELELEYLKDTLINMYKPFMPFLSWYDYVRAGIVNFDSSDFQYYYIVFILWIREKYPESIVEKYKRDYNRCERKDSCKYYIDCSKYKKCTRMIYSKHAGDYFESHIEERYNSIIKGIRELIKKDTEAFENEFNEFQQEFIEYFLKWVSPGERSKALSKLHEVFKQINQTNLFTKKLTIDSFGKQKPLTGIFLIKWNQVDFFDGYFLVWHPRIPYNKAVPLKVIDPNSRKIFNKINKLFLNKLDPLCVEAKDGKITQVLNQTSLSACITLMEHHVTMPNLKKKKNQPKIEKKEITKHEAQEICHKLKSQFLDYLCSKQLANYNVICCIEHRVNATQTIACEYSFIFTVKETNNKLYLAYENSSELRCTYIFPIARDSWHESIDNLYDFFASNAVNKRQLLTLRQVNLELPGNYEYRRVLHSDFSSWVERINLR